MEIQFIKTQLQCLQPFYTQVQNQEQTQEIRIPDAYPDIGRILGCWGQVMIRGKEWRATSMGANGGIMAWVLYAPEDGTQPRVVDTWVPFQWRWDFPENTDDGVIHLCPVIAQMDCRGVSARKIMVRAVVANCGHGMRKWKAELASAPDLPEDVQVLTKTYPMELPVEAGEKQVQLEELFTLPGENSKVIGYKLNPVIQEQKVLGNRLVFRGMADLSVMYMTEDGQINLWNGEFPFSQYTELDKDYTPGATAWVLPIVTALELDMGEDGQLQMHGGIAAQYTIFDKTVMDVVEDAFSPVRNVRINSEELQIPALLDSKTMEIHAEGKLEGDIDSVLAVFSQQEYPVMGMGEHGMEITMEGQFRALFRNPEGEMMGDSVHFKISEDLDSAHENHTYLWLDSPSEIETALMGDGLTVNCRYPLSAQTYSGEKIAMVTDLELGESKEPDPNRPSIILRRAGDEGLWTIAKNCGSTVAAIKEANALTDEPEYGQMLLIPVS